MDEISQFDLLVADQRREFMTAVATESDLDFAFRLQMEEALIASASISPSSSTLLTEITAGPSSSTAVSVSADLSHALDLQFNELSRYQLERRDNELRRNELRRLTEDLRRSAHDEKMALEMANMSELDWIDFGDDFKRPMERILITGEPPFRLYFKGMTREELVQGSRVQFAGIGVAICDPKGNLLVKIQKPVIAAGINREMLDAQALIEGLTAIVELGIKNVNIYFEFRPLLNHVTGRWKAKQQKIANLVNQVLPLQQQLAKCQMFLLPRGHVKFVFKLARDAIDSQITKTDLIQGKANNGMKETCTICLETIVPSQMFSIEGCGHRFCFSCMRQHVEVRLLHGRLPNCLHLGCNVRLEVENSRKFLSPRLLTIMSQRIREDSIPPNEKVYCPYKKCSALMSTNEAYNALLNGSAKQIVDRNIGLRSCIKCRKHFCINCKVPWHAGLSCSDYMRSSSHLSSEDFRLHSLAKEKFWRQCGKCNHMIELLYGCFHIKCRCGHEFCYTCGAERYEEATCDCPIWNEENIWLDDTEGSEDDDFEDDEFEDDEFEDYEEEDDDEYDDAY